MKAAVLVGLLLLPSVGLAQDEQNCLPYPDMITGLSSRFHEVPRQAGVLDDIHNGKPRDGFVQFLQSGDGDTWTILLITRDGEGKARACIVAAGTGWVDRRPGI